MITDPRPLHALLVRTLPLLVQLGDHIGNGPIDPDRMDSHGQRCDLIGDIRDALEGPDLAPPLTQLEFAPEDHATAEAMARQLGYQQYSYTSTSDLWGLFCLPENADRPHVSDTRRRTPPYRPGCIIKTQELGLLFVQDAEDLGLPI